MRQNTDTIKSMENSVENGPDECNNLYYRRFYSTARKGTINQEQHIGFFDRLSITEKSYRIRTKPQADKELLKQFRTKKKQKLLQ